MLNKLEKFRSYTAPVQYTVRCKGDIGFLGQFTMESLLNYEGMGRILTILARGYLPDTDRARKLCVHGAAFRTAKKPRQRRRSRIGQISGSCMSGSQSLWMREVQAGSIAMSITWQTLCRRTQMTCGKAMGNTPRPSKASLTRPGEIRCCNFKRLFSP